ncbi:MAG: glycine/sarcosine/betaine reductase complex selenoprotein A, partial [Oscillospiraceae bacterium]|nr:glycine/sarcosine/betaine reductase complex selenoprotein A [Oscillospiraceae bacterium]
EQVSMMEMVLDVDDIINEMSSIRDEYCKYLG